MKKSIIVFISLLMISSFLFGSCKSKTPTTLPASTTPQEIQTPTSVPSTTPATTTTAAPTEPKPTPTPVATTTTTPTPTPTPTSTPTTTTTATPTPSPTQEPTAQNDFENLTDALLVISGGGDSMWEPSAVDLANSILSKEEYTVADWQAYFTDFFAGNPIFTDGLRSYLGYAVFEWPGEDTQLKLQTSLVKPLLDLIDSFMDEYGDSLDSALSENTQRETLMNAHRFINALAGGSWYKPPKITLPENIPHEVYEFYIEHVKKHKIFRIDGKINPVSQPYLGAVRAQVYMNLRDAVPLTTAIKTEIGNALGLKLRYYTTWHSSSVLIIDNLSLTDSQLAVIAEILNNVPVSVQDLGSITVNDALGNSGYYYMWYMTRYVVDIYGIPDSRRSFGLMMAKLINRTVDDYLTDNDPEYTARKGQLIEQAGIESYNYLRSDVSGGYFVENPEAFFEEIAYLWFISTKNILDLAVSRFQEGYEGPINQFLFFGEVYLIESDSVGDRIPFIEFDSGGHIKKINVPVGRDAKGRIISLRYSNDNYYFALDPNGNVIEITIK